MIFFKKDLKQKEEFQTYESSVKLEGGAEEKEIKVYRR